MVKEWTYVKREYYSFKNGAAAILQSNSFHFLKTFGLSSNFFRCHNLQHENY